MFTTWHAGTAFACAMVLAAALSVTASAARCVAQPPAVTSVPAAAGCPAAPYGARFYAPGSSKTVALTFDDGPGKSTAAILAILARYRVPATFFNIGVNMPPRPSLVREEVKGGLLLAVSLYAIGEESGRKSFVLGPFGSGGYRGVWRWRGLAALLLIIGGKRHTDEEREMILTDPATNHLMPGPILPRDGDRFAAWLADLTWAKLFPEGRDLCYEGERPDKFTEIIREEFGFDPSADPLWGKWVEGNHGGPGFISYGFHCPAKHIDAIYAMHGSQRFPGRVLILCR